VQMKIILKKLFSQNFDAIALGKEVKRLKSKGKQIISVRGSAYRKQRVSIPIIDNLNLKW